MQADSVRQAVIEAVALSLGASAVLFLIFGVVPAFWIYIVAVLARYPRAESRLGLQDQEDPKEESRLEKIGWVVGGVVVLYVAGGVVLLLVESLGGG